MTDARFSGGELDAAVRVHMHILRMRSRRQRGGMARVYARAAEQMILAAKVGTRADAITCPTVSVDTSAAEPDGRLPGLPAALLLKSQPDSPRPAHSMESGD